MRNSEVAYKFSQKLPAKTENMFTDGQTIWSYGTHWPIATYVGRKVAIVTKSKYSKSTLNQTGCVWNNVLGKYEIVEVSILEMKDILSKKAGNDEKILFIRRDIEPKTNEEMRDAVCKFLKSKGVKPSRAIKFANEIKGEMERLEVLNNI